MENAQDSKGVDVFGECRGYICVCVWMMRRRKVRKGSLVAVLLTVPSDTEGDGDEYGFRTDANSDTDSDSSDENIKRRHTITITRIMVLTKMPSSPPSFLHASHHSFISRPLFFAFLYS